MQPAAGTRAPVVEFFVTGVPVPQGSLRAFVPKGWTHPVVTSDNPNLKDWRLLVACAAAEQTLMFAEGPVALRLSFCLPRPKSLPKKVLAHTKKPDLDKLVRAVKDALKKVLYTDDAQVVELYATKRYGVGVGVRVRIESAEAR